MFGPSRHPARPSRGCLEDFGKHEFLPSGVHGVSICIQIPLNNICRSLMLTVHSTLRGQLWVDPLVISLTTQRREPIRQRRTHSQQVCPTCTCLASSSSIDQSINQSINQTHTTNKAINYSIHQPTNPSAFLSIKPSINQATNQSK